MMSPAAGFVLLILALLLGLDALDFVDFKEMSGEGFEIFSPLQRFGLSKHSREGLLPPPERFVKEMTLRFVQLEAMVNDTLVPNKSPLERAQQAYVDFLLNFVLGRPCPAASASAAVTLSSSHWSACFNLVRFIFRRLGAVY